MEPTQAPQATPSTPLPPVQPTSQQPTSSSKPGKLNKIILAVVVAVIIIAGVGYGVYAYMTAGSPDNLLRQAITQVDTSTFAAKLKIVRGTDANGLTISGDVAYRVDPSNAKNGELVVGLGSGNSRIALTGMMLDDVTYIKLGNLTNLPNLIKTFGGAEGAASFQTPQFKALLKAVNNQWFSVSQEDLKALGQSAGSEVVQGAPTSEDAQKVKAIYDKHPFIKADVVYGDEVVEGTNSSHFNVKLDRATYKAFLQELKSANLQSFQVTDEDIAKAETEAERSSDGTVEVWVARDSKKLKQIKVVSTDVENPVTVTATLSTELPELQPLQKPANAKPLMQLLAGLFGGQMTPPALNPNSY